MSALIQNFRYRPEIDGLRAVAVFAVVLYHAELGCPGGYVGVDIFFVISGFLITSLILKDLQQDRFTLALFWERRARRILPALVVVTLVTLSAGWLLLVPSDYANLGKSAIGQAIFAANIYFWRTGGYFGGLAQEKPLLHTWSLAVEEQFYLIVPIVLLALFRFGTILCRHALCMLFAVGFIVSFLASIYGVGRYPNAAFYFLPFRAWELLLGSFLTVLPNSLVPTQRPTREIVSYFGLAGILIPCFVYDSETTFPGIAAVPPCLGTVLIILATNRSSPNHTPTSLGCSLATSPVVFIGLISYSLYLWHWPILAFSRYCTMDPLSLQYRLGALTLAVLISVLSWQFVEMPFRQRRVCASRRSVFAFASVGLSSVLVSGGLIIVMRGFPDRLPQQALIYAEAKTDVSFINELSTEDILAGELVPIGNPDSNTPPRVLVWGDSFAMSALPAFDTFLKEKGIAGRAATHTSRRPVVGCFRKGDLGEEAIRYNDAVFSYIHNHRIPTVVLIARWTGDTVLMRNDGISVPVDFAVLTTVQRLVEAGVSPWVFLTWPVHDFNVPEALVRSVLSGEDIVSHCAKPGASNGLCGTDNDALLRIERVGGRLLDPRPRFLSPDHEHYVVSTDGIPLYRDRGHLTTKGSLLMLLPLLRDSFDMASLVKPEPPAMQSR